MCIRDRLYTYTEEQRLIQFLMGLNSSYTAVRGNILMMSLFPTMSQAYSLLVQEERQRQHKIKHHFLGENTSFFARTSNTSFPTRTSKHPFIPRKSDERKPILFCEHCKRNGYTIEKCYKIHGFPNKSQARGRGGYNQSSNRRAYNTWTEHIALDGQTNQPESQSAGLPRLSPEQSKQLYQFLSNLTSSNQAK